MICFSLMLHSGISYYLPITKITVFPPPAPFHKTRGAILIGAVACGKHFSWFTPLFRQGLVVQSRIRLTQE